MKKLLFCASFFIILSGHLKALDLTDINFKYLYDPINPFYINKSVSCRGDTLLLKMFIELKGVAKSEDIGNLQFISQEDYDSEKHEVLEPLNIESTTKEKLLAIEASFLISNQHNYFIAGLTYNGFEYFVEHAINKEAFFPCSNISFFKKNNSNKVLNTLIYPNDTVLFNEGMNVEHPMYIYRYENTFPPALPPMTLKGTPQKSLKIDTLIIDSKVVSKQQNWLYFVQSDSSSNRGVSFLSVESYFPKFKTPDELIEPLIYICTKVEFDNMINADSKKTAFESFWISKTNSQERARRAIRNFYRRVEHANRVFTSYKEGWKTDQGMIYIVHGLPDQISRTATMERWVYHSSDGAIEYRFDKVANLFTQFHYALQREKQSYKSWFREVANWRKGG